MRRARLLLVVPFLLSCGEGTSDAVGPTSSTTTVESTTDTWRPTGDWTSTNIGEMKGVRWTLYSVPATLASDPTKSGICYTIEFDPPDIAGVDPGELSPDDVHNGRPVRSCEPVTGGSIGITPIQPLVWSVGGPYTWLAAATVPGTQTVVLTTSGESQSVPVKADTIVWLSSTTHELPTSAELRPIGVACDLEDRDLTYRADCRQASP